MRFFSFRRGVLSLRLFDRKLGFFRRPLLRRGAFSFSGFGIARRSSRRAAAAPTLDFSSAAPRGSRRSSPSRTSDRRRGSRQSGERRGWFSRKQRCSRPRGVLSPERLEGRRVLATSFAGRITDLDALSDSGFDYSDNYTNDNTPSFTISLSGITFGATPAGSGPERVELVVDGNIVASVASVAGTPGPITLTSSVLADGTHTAFFRSVDSQTTPATGAPSTTLTFTIDTTSPTLVSFVQPSTTFFSSSQNIDFTVTWSENVYTSATPIGPSGGTANPGGQSLPLVIGTFNSTLSPIQNSSAAVYVGGTSTPTLTLRHTVGNPDNDNNDADGVQVFAQTNTLATATATINASGQVTGITGLVGGTGYSSANPPTVTFSGGGGTNAAGIATVNGLGVVTGVTMTNNGSGYITAPSVTFSYPSVGAAAFVNPPVDKAGNFAATSFSPNLAPYSTGVRVQNQTGTASSAALSGVTPGELRTTPVTGVTLSILNAAASVGAGVGQISTLDFVLTRNGAPVAGFPLTAQPGSPQAATLSYVVAGAGTYSQFLLGSLEQYTDEPGFYSLSFQDLAICPEISVQWVKSTETAGELIATLTPLPSSTFTRSTPVNQVRVQFGDTAGTANFPPVINVETVTGAAINQFTLLKDGVVVPWTNLLLAGVTITGSNTTYYVNGLEAYTTANPGSYELRLNGNRGDLPIQTLTGTQMITTYSAAWEYVTPTTFTVAPPADGTYRRGEYLVFTAAFDDIVTVSGATSIPLTIGTSAVSANYASGSGTRTLTFTYPIGNTDLDTDGIALTPTITGTIIDSRGVAVPPAFTRPNTSQILVDGTVPTILSVEQPTPKSYVTNDNLDVTVTFSEAVTVTGTPSIPLIISGVTRQATWQSAVGNKVVFRYQVQSSDVSNGSLTIGQLALNGGTIRDAASNDYIAAAIPMPTVSGVVINRTAPSVTVSSGTNKTYKLGDVIELTATFTLPVTVTGTGANTPFINLAIGNTTRQALYSSGSGSTAIKFQYPVAPGDVDTDGIAVPTAVVSLPGTGTVTDSAGVPVLIFNTPAGISSVLIDGVAPVPLAAVAGPTPGSYFASNTATLKFTVPYNDSVKVTGVPTLAFSLGSSIRQATYSGVNTPVNALEFTYHVQSGDFGLAVSVAADAISLNGGTIVDANGNNAVTTIAATTFSNVVVNQVAITAVTIASVNNRYYRAGENVLLDVQFSAPVTVTGIPTLALALQSGTATAAYVSGSGTDTLQFAYRVVNGDLDPDGVQFASTAIALGTGQILSAGGPALLNFLAPDISGIRVDAQVPTISGPLSVPANRSYRVGDTLTFVIAFSESMVVTGTPRIAMVIGSSTKYANYVAGTDTPVLQFEYQIAEGDVDSNGIVVSNGIQLNSGNISDVAGNGPALTFTTPSTASILIDGDSPRVTAFTSSQSNGNYKAGDTISLAATLSKTVVAGSAIDATLNTGAIVRLTTATAGRTLSGTYTIASGENSIDLDVLSYVDSGATFDVAGNPLRIVAMPTGASSLAGSKSLVVDTIAPTVLGFSSTTSAGTYRAGNSIVVTATMSDTVRAGSAISAVLTTGGTVALTTTLAGNALTGIYVVPAGANTPKLDVTSFTFGTALDIAGNPIVDTTLPAAKISDNQVIVIDTKAPFVQEFKSTTSNGTYIATKVIAIVAELSEPVAANSTMSVTLDTGATVPLTATAPGTTLTGNYQVAPGDFSPKLKVVSFSSANFSDAVGNPFSDYSLPASNIDTTSALIVDARGPSVTATTAVPLVGGAGTALITFSLDEAGSINDPNGVTATGGTLSSLTGSGRTFTAIFTPASNSTAPGTITAAAGTFIDAHDNLSTAATFADLISVDTIAPTVVVASSASSLRNSQTATITFTFPESVTYSGSGVSAVGGTLSAVTGSGRTYTAIFSPAASSTTAGMVSVAANAFTDAAGNGNAAGSLATPITIDTVAPTVAVSSTAAALRIGQTATITFTLSEPGSYSGSGITASGGTLSAVSGSGATYTALFTPANNSIAPGAVNVAAGAFSDTAGNASVASLLASPIAVDTVAPSVTITPSPTALRAGGTSAITFTLSEQSTDFDSTDVVVTGGTLSPVTGSGRSYTATFTPAANSAAPGTISVAAARFTDAAGNDNVAGSLSPSISIDTILPTPSVVSSASSLRIGQTATITFTFAEAVTYSGSGITATGGTLSAIAGSGTAFTAVFTPATNSTTPGIVSVAAGAFTDAAGNPSVATALATSITIDTVAPAVTVSTSVAALGIGQTATITFAFAEAVTYSGAGITATGGTLSAIAGSGTSFTAIFTPAANSTAPATISVAANAFTDTAGNGGVAGGLTLPISVDTVAPTLTITSSAPSLRIGQTATISFTLSEISTTFTNASVTATGGTLSSMSGSGRNYTATFTPDTGSTAPGTISVTAGKFTDAAGNDNAPAVLAVPIAIDTVAPTIQVAASPTSLKAGQTATITFTLSEASTNFAQADVSVTAGSGTLSNWTPVSSTSYTATFTPTAGFLGTSTISIAAATFTDAAGNDNTASAPSASISIDTVAPTVQVAASPTSLKAGQTATITFTLSEASTNFAQADVSVTAGSGTLSNWTAVSGTSYTATFTPTAGYVGTSTVSVAAAAFTDAAGNDNTASSPSASISIDTVAPTVQVAASPTSLKAGQTATITFTLSEASTNFSLANIVATGGSVSSLLGSGTSYTATFTPNVNSTTPGMISVPASAFTDAAGNGNVAGALIVPLSIDTVAPTVTIQSNLSALNSKQTAAITFIVSETMTTFGQGNVLTQGGTLSNFSGSGTTYTATFTPTPNSTVPGTILIPSASFADAGGNPNSGTTLAAPITIDTVRPTVSIATNTAAVCLGQTATITFVLSRPTANFDVRNVTVTGGTLSALSGSGSNYSSVFTPFPNTTELASVSVAAGAFTDSAGNDNVAGVLGTPISVDTVAPTIIITSSDDILASGRSATITFLLSKATTNFTRNDVTVVGGTLSNFSGSGFNYSATFTPLANSTTPGNVSVAAGAFTDAAGNSNLAGALANPITIDTVLPVVTSFTSSAQDGTYVADQQIPLEATLSKDVAAGGAFDVVLNTGVTITLTALEAGRTLTGFYPVSAGEKTGDLDITSVQLSPFAPVVDLAGNVMSSTSLPAPNFRLAFLKNIAIAAEVAATAPGFSSSLSTVPDKRTITSIPITFNTEVYGLKLSSFVLMLGSRRVSLTKAVLIGSGRNYVLTLPAGRASLKGIYTLQINPAGITAAANSALMTTASKIYWGNGTSIAAPAVLRSASTTPRSR